MPCHSAVEQKKIVISSTDTVESALETLRKEKVFAIAVNDEDDKFLGVFSMKVLLKNLIPVSVAMSNGVEIDIKVTAAPGIAKRLENMKLHPVSEVADRKAARISPDTPIWEGVSLLTKSGEPLCVIDEKGKFKGFITYESLVSDLENTDTTDS